MSLSVAARLGHYAVIAKLGEGGRKVTITPPLRLRERLIELLNHDSGPFRLRTKLMYGSDWHMPDVIRQTRKYLELFMEMFQDSKLEEHAPYFFAANAARFLNLRSYLSRHNSRPALAQRDQLEALLAACERITLAD